MATAMTLSLSSSFSPSFFSHYPTCLLTHFHFNSEKPRRRTLMTRASISAAPTPIPTLTTSSSGIVLVDKLDSDKLNRLKLHYLEKVVPILKVEFGYTNIHAIPRIEKIVVNCGIGDAEQNKKGLEDAMKNLSLITGQKPMKAKAKRSIANFKLREGSTVGIFVTLRRKVMYCFLDRLINLGLPRTRDFQGVSPDCFDGYGNYNLGIHDQSIFPEIKYEASGKRRGMDVCITTSAKTDAEAHRLLALLGMPFNSGIGGPKRPRKKRKINIKKKAPQSDSKPE